MRQTAPLVLSALSFFVVVLVAPSLHAQIIGSVHADIHHRFTVGEATLPAGNYVFRMVPHTDLALMTVTSADGNTSDEFLVRRSIDSQVPHHTELVFNRYGDQEFLTDIYEHGEKTGIAVVEPSREQSRLQKLGQDPVVHTEEQDQ